MSTVLVDKTNLKKSWGVATSRILFFRLPIVRLVTKIKQIKKNKAYIVAYSRYTKTQKQIAS